MKRQEIKDKLDELGVPYKGNASNAVLEELYDNAMQESVDAVSEVFADYSEEERQEEAQPSPDMLSSTSRTFMKDGVNYMKFYNEHGDTLKIVKLG